MRILLHLINEQWHAQFEDNGEVKALFGTDTIPTPFTAKTDTSHVLKAIANLNPGVEVILATHADRY